MKSLTHKLLACLLAVVMLVGIIPAAAAQDGELITVAGANMTLGNELVLNIMVDAASVTGEGLTAVVTHHAEDGDVVSEVPQSDWETYSNGRYYKFSAAVAAAQMIDQVSIEIVDAEGNVCSEAYSSSVRDYAGRMLDDSERKVQTLLVDMLNYGAAAQEYFTYRTEDPANAELTEEQQELATGFVSCTDIHEVGENYVGSNLSLEECILLNFMFEPADAEMTATVEFTDTLGRDVCETVEVKSKGQYAAVTVDQIVLSDSNCPVTVTVYNADGTVYGWATDSVESYVARMGAEEALYANIMKFAASAYEYLSERNQGADQPSVDTELSANVEVGEDGTVQESVSMAGETVQATVPAGVAVEKTELTLTVSELSESGADVTVSDEEDTLSLDVHVDGVSKTNTTAILVNLGKILPEALNQGNVALYHVEEGATNEMVQVLSLSELDAHNEFYYDPATGEVTVALASFSEIMMKSGKSIWNGIYDYAWYSKGVTLEDGTTEYVIANADQLAGFGAIVGGMAKGIEIDDFAGDTVKLLHDISIGDLTDEDDRDIVFYPIGYWNSEGTYEKSGKAITSDLKPFKGTFDGNGHTISDWYQNTWEMKGDHHWYAAADQNFCDGFGLFGFVYGGTVKNLTVKNYSCDSEIGNTGCIAAYADYGATFENIAIFDCNPRVYNIGNGGIVGNIGWFLEKKDEGITTPITFKNITVDNSNKITALWGSWDVSCGGIVGFYDIFSKYGVKNPGVHFENCHVAAQIDVFNDVCANYQYYAYRYSGILMGTVSENETIDGHVYPQTDTISAKNCTVHFGDWNDYYYCELVANSLASYTHDHQMSRLTQVESVDTTNMKVTDLDGNTTDIPNGRVNYVVVKNKDSKTGMWIHGDGKDFATCYHFVNGVQHFHDEADADNPNIWETVDNKEVLKEDKQLIYREFNNLFTGYGWGVTSKGLTNLNGVEILDIKSSEMEDSVKKFDYIGKDSYGYTTDEMGNPKLELQIGEIFKAITGTTVKVDNVDGVYSHNVQVFVSPANNESSVSATYAPNAQFWALGKLNFSGVGLAEITITDYYYCEPTTVIVEIKEHASTPDAKDVISIDFKAFAKDAADEAWWATLQEMQPTHLTKAPMGGVDVAINGAWVGTHNAPTAEASSEGSENAYMSAEAIAAYEQMIAFMQKNYGWYLDEDATDLTTSKVKKGFWLSGDDYATWGMSFYSAHMNKAQADFVFVVDVDQAGMYEMEMTAFYEALFGAYKIDAYETYIKDGNKNVGHAGAGFVDILVNGEWVINDYSTFGSAENGNPNATMTTYLANVWLNEGENTIAVRPALSQREDVSGHRRNINLKSIDFTYVGECPNANAHTIGVCEVCGEEILPEGTYLIDFKAFAKKIAKQSFYEDLRTMTGEKGSSKFIGIREEMAMSETEQAAYNELLAYQKDNYNWYIDEESTPLNLSDRKISNKGIFLNADKDVTWGLSYLSGGFDTTSAHSKLNLKVKVNEAGVYAVDLTAFHEANYGASTLGPNAGFYSGSGYAKILVNGVPVGEEYAFSGLANNKSLANRTAVAKIGYAYFEEGWNTVTINTTKDVNESIESLARTISLKDMTLVKQNKCPLEHKAGQTNVTCSLCHEVIPATYIIDFKAFAQDAAQYPNWWDDLKASNDNTRFIGILGRGDTTAGGYKLDATAEAAYALMRKDAWDLYGWTINETLTDLKANSSIANRGVWLCAAEDAPFGLVYLSAGCDDETKDVLTLDVKVEQDGWYAIDIKAYHGNEYSDVNKWTAAGTNRRGSGMADIFVNGNKLTEEPYAFSGIINEANTNKTEYIGTLYAYLFKDVANTITINVVEEADNDITATANQHRTICLETIDLTWVSETCPKAAEHETLGNCNICGYIATNEGADSGSEEAQP